MKTPPPWIGGQIGYGETKSTLSFLGCAGRTSKVSRKCPPCVRRNASRSEMCESDRARRRARMAKGRLKVARAMPAKLERSGDSMKSQASIAVAHVKKKWPGSRRQSWMFFQVNSRKFFF